MSQSPSKKELTHARIVEVAGRAIRRGGFQGVGVADVMKEAGLTHGGFYAHFASRDALLVEALEQAGRDNARALGERMARFRDRGESDFAALVKSYLHDDQLDDLEDGCVVAALASETTRQPTPVREAAQARVEALIRGVTRCLPKGASSSEAQVVAATMVGALQLARSLEPKSGRALLSATRKSLLARYIQN